MKKYLIHVVYLLIIAFFIFYANIKAQEAEIMGSVALSNDQRAEDLQKVAFEGAELAKQQMNLAKQQLEELKKELEACKQ